MIGKLCFKATFACGANGSAVATNKLDNHR